jgi:hypothetical protein
MWEDLQAILREIYKAARDSHFSGFTDPSLPLSEQPSPAAEESQYINAAFLAACAGRRHPDYEKATNILANPPDTSAATELAEFYRHGLREMQAEITAASTLHPELATQFRALRDWVEIPENLSDSRATAERFWEVFCPEAAAIRGNEKAALQALRKQRTIEIDQLNDKPISDPAREVLFTSNVLLTLPQLNTPADSLGVSLSGTAAVRQAEKEPQQFWYDHPIQLGAPLANNEAVYGLQGLDRALAWEKDQGNLSPSHKCVCVLSVSTTHSGLHSVAREYLEKELSRTGGLNNLHVYVFTEEDVETLIKDVLAPAATRYLDRKDSELALDVLGTDGPYGRHYGFLKSIAALWQVLLDPGIRATFKFDLDQVFPQDRLLAETGESALEHLTTPLWGARGTDGNGHAVELGMLAGALVNQSDIENSLFAPDVPYPKDDPAWDEWVFLSSLPQALSTEAEMMTRYDSESLDGRRTCLQRVHVTGGTTGILVESLRRHRPFVPSFIGRAEDQAYVLSLLNQPGPFLTYLHKPGLIMRHDKHAFAGEAVSAASLGKLIGDYERILLFSAYVHLLAREPKNPTGWAELKEHLDPFTGCFASRLPVTVALLRFALKAAHFYASGKTERGRKFLAMGHRRLKQTLDLVGAKGRGLETTIRRERKSWDLYYDTLSALETALEESDDFALQLKRKTQQIVRSCKLATDS